VTITGMSMGGIGAASVPLHHPGIFAAAEPLCGYHSYFVRGDIGGARMRPWERFIAEQRSNVFWAENGLYIPMFVVHGTKDLPEENSKVLIDRYKDLGYAMKHEHPELGHNVWQTTYEELKGAHWLMWHQRPLHPRVLRFKTPSTRWADDAWVHVKEMASSDQWGEVIARIDKENGIHVSTRGVADLALDRDAERIDDAAPVTLSIDQSKLVFQAGQSQLGVAFIRPNPRRPDRYVLVVEGTGPLGTWRSLSLPDMLPDFVVFDEDVTPSRGGLLLGGGEVRAGGFFRNDWSLPAAL